MTDEALDVFARQLLLDASSLEVSSAPQEKHTFSPDFERKMKKMIRRVEHPVRHRVGQAAACVLLVAVLGFSSVMAFSAEARAAVFGWIREVYETYFVYRYEGGEAVVPEDVVYMPTWVPEGYEMTVAPEPGVQVSAIYQNTDGQTVLFVYGNVDYNTDSALFIPTEGLVAQGVDMNGGTADLYLDSRENEPNVIVWTDDETGYIFYISGHLSGEDLIKMAESVTAFDAAQFTMENAVFRPTWLPDGYVESMVPELDGQVAVIYKNEAGNLMSFSYSTDPEIINLQVGGNKGSIERVFIGDLPGDLYIDAEEDAHDVLVWMDDQNGIIYWISANLSGEDMIKIAESVTAFDATEPEQ